MQDKRKAIRRKIPFTFRAAIQTFLGHAPERATAKPRKHRVLKAQVMDLSRDGIGLFTRIFSRRPCDPGQQVGVNMKLWDGSAIFAEGEVRWVGQHPNKRGYLFGVYFTRIDPKDGNRMHQFLRELDRVTGKPRASSARAPFVSVLGPIGRVSAVPKETMSSRERWLAVLNRQAPDRVPMDIWITPEAARRLQDYLGCDWDAILERLHIDNPLGVGGRYVGPAPKEGEDIWGLRYRQVDYGAGVYNEVVYSPLAGYGSVEEIQANYTWPNPDHWDYSHLPETIRGNGHRVIQGGGSEPFYQYKFLRGDHQAFLDLIEHPDIAHYCLDKLFDIAYQNTLRIFETIPGQVAITYVAEDLGAQDGLMYAPGHIREFLLPGMKRMMDLTRQHGSHVFTHSDGAVREIIPDLIAIGTQVLNPIQWRCKEMDREGLKRDFGDKLIFHGGVDNQYTLPFGTVDEVRREVLDNYRILGAGGGYILAPCHNIQSVSPPENIVAMYETGYECGWR